MARNEEGEFELVLGNRQLVSVFLIVVILLGVFFSMGYIVGRNSSSTQMADSGGRGSSGKPIVVDNSSRAAAQPVEPAGAPVQPPAELSKPSPVPAEPTREEPKKPEPKRDDVKREEAKREEAKREEAKREEAKREEAKKRSEPAAAPSSEDPRSGQTFLQVVATTRPDADGVAESLSKRGFRTTVAAGPNPSLHRVLVGPLRDAGDIADTRAKLEGLGFKPYVRRY